MRRYILAPEAALDLVEIWRYLRNEAGVEIAERVERAIREKIVSLASMPGAGHWRRDLTVAILHGNRDVETILSKRL